MTKNLSSFMDDQEVPAIRNFLFSLEQLPSAPLLLRNDILLAFEHFQTARPVPLLHTGERFLRKVQEMLHLGDYVVLVHRRRPADCHIYRLNRQENKLTALNTKEFLTLKEQLVKPDNNPGRSIDINLAPFYDYGPSLKDPNTIGQGIRHLNRHMSANLSQQPERWNQALYDFLKLHHLHGIQLLLDGNMIRDVKELAGSLEDAIDFLERCECPDDPNRLKDKLRSMGFLDGWGDNGSRILETIRLLQDILEQPNEETLEEFLSRIPMVSKVALISPHGWFGQDNVLGRPDTGGQVVYILDQAKALEQFLEQDLNRAGIDIEPRIMIITRLIPENEDTTSDQRLEKVRGTKNVHILRVPFRDRKGQVLSHWISRFKIWPYLDQFTRDAETAIQAELQSRPDLLVGNYSDGNLVAAGLSQRMGVIQCNIAHALEKSKYLFSDLYWENFEQEYHFSVQFMADLIAMNLANFIITSTRQEIVGTDKTIGQYESYQFFTMPGLMQVTNGINLFHPRFNVIPPGVNNDIFFPCRETARRMQDRTARITELLFTGKDPDCYGHLENPDLPAIFSIARLDRIKNLSGLVEAYGQDQELRAQANIILIASLLNPDLSRDAEEAAEIQKMYDLIKHYDLHGHIRWIGKFLSKEDTGEAYRVVADRKGFFVQPALFEAFGLTILEAMHSGLPVFATEFGGPQEIIEDNISGFLINPTAYGAMTDKMKGFVTTCQKDPNYWQTISDSGLARAQKHFTWNLYCRRLIRLTKVYGFWKYSTSSKAKVRLTEYCHLLYHLFFEKRAATIE